MGDKGGKAEKIKEKRGLKIFCLFENNSDRLCRLTIFLC